MHQKKSCFLSFDKVEEAQLLSHLSTPVLTATEFSLRCCSTANRAIYIPFIVTSAGPSLPICRMNGVLGSLFFEFTQSITSNDFIFPGRSQQASGNLWSVQKDPYSGLYEGKSRVS